MKFLNFILKLTTVLLFVAEVAVGHGSDIVTYDDDSSTVLSPYTGNQDLSAQQVGETQITKEYMTALVLDGLYRVYKAGLEFTTSNSFRDLKAVDDTLVCAFKKFPLMKIDRSEFDEYHTCITAKGLIDGGNNEGIVFTDRDIVQMKRRSEDPTPPLFAYYSGTMSTTLTRNCEESFVRKCYIYPSPLALLYWGAAKIGRDALSFDKGSDTANTFESLVLQIISTINKRHSIGERQYIDLLADYCREMQSILDQYAKKNIQSDSDRQSNLQQLHLTINSAAGLGKVISNNVNMAYVINEPKVSDDIAEMLAKKFVELVHEQKLSDGKIEEMYDYEDRAIEVFDAIANSYKGITGGVKKPPLKVSGSKYLFMNGLRQYYDYVTKNHVMESLDDNYLKDAFHVGRILKVEEGTVEYDAGIRNKELEQQRQQMLPGNNNQQLPAAPTREDL